MAVFQKELSLGLSRDNHRLLGCGLATQMHYGLPLKKIYTLTKSFYHNKKKFQFFNVKPRYWRYQTSKGAFVENNIIVKINVSESKVLHVLENVIANSFWKPAIVFLLVYI